MVLRIIYRISPISCSLSHLVSEKERERENEETRLKSREWTQSITLWIINDDRY